MRTSVYGHADQSTIANSIVRSGEPINRRLSATTAIVVTLMLVVGGAPLALAQDRPGPAPSPQAQPTPQPSPADPNTAWQKWDDHVDMTKKVAAVDTAFGVQKKAMDDYLNALPKGGEEKATAQKALNAAQAKLDAAISDVVSSVPEVVKAEGEAEKADADYSNKLYQLRRQEERGATRSEGDDKALKALKKAAEETEQNYKKACDKAKDDIKASLENDGSLKGWLRAMRLALLLRRPQGPDDKPRPEPPKPPELEKLPPANKPKPSVENEQTQLLKPETRREPELPHASIALRPENDTQLAIIGVRPIASEQHVIEALKERLTTTALPHVFKTEPVARIDTQKTDPMARVDINKAEPIAQVDKKRASPTRLSARHNTAVTQLQRTGAKLVSQITTNRMVMNRVQTGRPSYLRSMTSHFGVPSHVSAIRAVPSVGRMGGFHRGRDIEPDLVAED
jgi:hypothetical protein